MTIIELFLVPLAFATVVFLLATPFVGVEGGWNLAAIAAVVFFTATYFTSVIRFRFFDKPRKCECLSRELTVLRVSRSGDYIQCRKCARTYWCSEFRPDGWKRCVRVEAGQARPWMRRRRWRLWVTDSDGVLSDMQISKDIEDEEVRRRRNE
jgi:hypothetical protein